MQQPKQDAASAHFAESLDALVNNLRFLREGQSDTQLEPCRIDVDRYVDPTKHRDVIKDPETLGMLEGTE